MKDEETPETQGSGTAPDPTAAEPTASPAAEPACDCALCLALARMAALGQEHEARRATGVITRLEINTEISLEGLLAEAYAMARCYIQTVNPECQTESEVLLNLVKRGLNDVRSELLHRTIRRSLEAPAPPGAGAGRKNLN
jgi:hypothetical protein